MAITRVTARISTYTDISPESPYYAYQMKPCFNPGTPDWGKYQLVEITYLYDVSSLVKILEDSLSIQPGIRI